MPDRTQIRPALPADLETLLAMTAEFYRHERIPFDRAASSAALATLMAEPTYGEVRLMVHSGQVGQHGLAGSSAQAGQVMGYLVLTFGYCLEFGGRYGFVDELYLRPEHRGQGIGTLALRKAEELCRRHRVASIALVVNRGNIQAQALYERRGYRQKNWHFLHKALESLGSGSATHG